MGSREDSAGSRRISGCFTGFSRARIVLVLKGTRREAMRRLRSLGRFEVTASMEPPSQEPQCTRPRQGRPRPVDDPRVYLAAERTFLAWIRTSLALMGFGFLIARFAILIRIARDRRHAGPIAPAGVLTLAGVCHGLLWRGRLPGLAGAASQLHPGDLRAAWRILALSPTNSLGPGRHPRPGRPGNGHSYSHALSLFEHGV